MIAHSHNNHDTTARGPGTRFKVSSVVRPRASVNRPSSIWIKTFKTHPRMMNQSSVKPKLAPNLGVTISSPEPTIEAVMMSPGPSCRRMPPTEVGAGWVSGGVGCASGGVGEDILGKRMHGGVPMGESEKEVSARSVQPNIAPRLRFYRPRRNTICWADDREDRGSRRVRRSRPTATSGRRESDPAWGDPGLARVVSLESPRWPRRGRRVGRW